MGQGIDQADAPVPIEDAKSTIELTQRLPALRLGLCADQVGEPFGLGQVQFAVEERTAAELPRFGQAYAVDRKRRLEAGHNHGFAAMHLQLRHILAGEAAWAGKPQHKPLIDELAGAWHAKPRQLRLPRRWQGPSHSPQNCANCRTGQANYRYPRSPCSGRSRDYCVMCGVTHLSQSERRSRATGTPLTRCDCNTSSTSSRLSQRYQTPSG